MDHNFGSYPSLSKILLIMSYAFKLIMSMFCNSFEIFSFEQMIMNDAMVGSCLVMVVFDSIFLLDGTRFVSSSFGRYEKMLDRNDTKWSKVPKNRLMIDSLLDFSSLFINFSSRTKNNCFGGRGPRTCKCQIFINYCYL